ncbi:MAG TPA: LamG domain-containing protein [Thermoanaerobaculia bacterium]|jgi:hypothetical protein
MYPLIVRPVSSNHTRILVLILAALALLLLLPAAAGAQPFNTWGVWNATAGIYIDIPHSADLNPTGAITIEAWVSNFPTNAGGETCRSVIGKNLTQTYWVGICGNTLRSHLAGVGSAKDGGAVPTSQWTHIAVTYDGVNRLHYINGELAGTFPEAGALPTNSSNVRIGSDVAWDFPPQGSIDEVRLWNVARTVEQIRGSINVPIATAMPGLVAVWNLDAGGNDAVDAHGGSVVGDLGFLNFPAMLTCGSGTSTAACLSGRFSVTVSWRDFMGNTGVGTVVSCPNPDSAMFYFFAPNSWEVLAKIVNGCGFNNHYWAFGAGATNVFYRLEFTDVQGGGAKIYFNYPGPPAAAVADAAAFATCP